VYFQGHVGKQSIKHKNMHNVSGVQGAKQYEQHMSKGSTSMVQAA